MRLELSVALLLANAPVAHSTEQPTDALQTAVLDEVLVTGEQPGPGLWRISKGDRTLWILGTYGPLPKKMTWRSREVESVIAESQRVVRWVQWDTDVDVGFFSGLAALPQIFTAGNSPEGATLQDVLPADTYEQWLPLKAKYIGRDKGVEKLRPAFAAMELRSEAVKAAGLSSDPPIWPAIRRLSKKHKVKVLEPTVKMEIKFDKPRAVIKKFKKTQLADVECFTESIARLEDDVDAMKARANAWARGKVDVLRKISPPDPSADCAQMLQRALLQGTLADDVGARETMDRMVAEFERVAEEQNELWLHTVENALHDHTSVLAIAPIDMLFNAQGPLQKLRERGYEVDEP